MLLSGGKKLIKRLWNKGNNGSNANQKLEVNANIPEHVAIIMDGNGRWANAKGLPRIAGHRSGMKTVKTITMAANDLGIKILTLYAFSTENWIRPKEEVDFLMMLPQQFFELEMDELIANNVKVTMMGEKDKLPKHTLKAVEDAIAQTSQNTGLILNFALNYGGRHELVEATKKIADAVQKGELQINDINEHIFPNYLQSSSLSYPDLLIRTSGEIRLSNFMLWQLAYSEFYFTDVYWPAFTEQHFMEAIYEYQRRARRFGGVKP